MRLFDLTLATPAENLALDEALLELAEAQDGDGEVLRLWEPAAPLVVLGRSSRAATEVHVRACQERGIPVLRRASGGASIVTDRGCLMYAVVLSYERNPQLRAIDLAHAFVLDRLAASLATLCPGVERQGTSDLAWGGRKFSGNSMRARREHLLYHGTLMYQLVPTLVEDCLRVAPRQPAYRQGRSHQDFVVNLPLARESLRQAVCAAWNDPPPETIWPEALVRRLVAEKYACPEWNDLP